MYAIRDLTTLDYERCGELISDPVYERLFAIDSIERLHLQSCYAAVAVQDDEIQAILLVQHQPQYFSEIEPKLQPGRQPGSRCQPLYTEYIWQQYRVEVPAFTTKFVSLAANSPGHKIALSQLIRAYFLYDVRNEYLFLNTFPYASLPDALRDFFPELESEQPIPSNSCLMRLCQRSDVLKPLTVKIAQMKDHDDLVEIFEQQNTRLKERFGEFYLAGIIERANPQTQLALVGNDYESNSDEIIKPVSFVYVEKFNQFNEVDGQCFSNLLATHQLEKYGLDQVATDKIAFIRATACYQVAESRSGDLLEYLFSYWPDTDLLLLSVPSNSSCMQMQMLRLFTLIEPRSCLSPKESLFVCHRDAWISRIKIQQIRDHNEVLQIQQNLQVAIQLNQQNRNIDYQLEVLKPGCHNGTLVAFSELQGKKVPIAIASVDLSVGQNTDIDIFKDYIQSYENEVYIKDQGRIIRGRRLEDKSLTVPENTIWKPARCLQGKTWCRIHYNEEIANYGYLKSLVIDPMYLQFKHDIIDLFIDACGVDGFLLQVGYELQKCIKQIYDPDAGEFIEPTTACVPSEILTPFEKELFRVSDYIENVNLLYNKYQKYYDNQLGQNYGKLPKQPEQYKSYTNSMYGENSKLHLDRQKDEILFNEKLHNEEVQDVILSAIRSLRPQFSLFAIRKQNQIKLFRPPVKLANQPQEQFVVKPPSLLTDRLVIVGYGTGLLSALQSIQDCHCLAQFQSITVVHPPPGMVYSFNFDAQLFGDQLFDHGMSLPQFKKRAANLFYDQFVGDVYEINLDQGYLKTAVGAEVQFDLLMICPDGEDSESLRQIPFYNLNSSVSFNYGNTDPCQLENKASILINKTQLSDLNKRGFNEEEIMEVISQAKQHCRLLQALYNQLLINQRARQQREQNQELQASFTAIQTRFKPHQSSEIDVRELLRSRLHSRTFFRYLQSLDQGAVPVMRRQLAAVNCATVLSNLQFCIGQLFSPNMLKQLKQKEQAEKGTEQDKQQKDGKDGDQESTKQGQQGDSDVATQQPNGYRFLSPGAKASQIIQVYNSQVQAELPLIIDRLSQTMMEAREQLFPDLYPKGSSKSDEPMKPIKTCSAVDVARTTVCVYGDTFEAFALIQAFLDKGVAPDSLVLLLPQDPNADVDPADQKQNDEIDYLMGNPGYSRVAPRQNCQVPDGLVNGQLDNQTHQLEHIESKSTTQNAEKRNENFPTEVHKNIIQSLRLNGVNIKENVKIIDLYASITNVKKQQTAEEGDENKSDEDEDETSEEFDEGEESDGSVDDDEEFDETVEITDQMVWDSCEGLECCDELDICLNKKFQGFGAESEELNPVLDRILLGREAEVLRDTLGRNDEHFNAADLPEDQREAELARLVKQTIIKLQKRARLVGLKKRFYRKKALNGSALNGVRLQLLKAEEDDGGAALKSNIPDSAAHPRTFQSPVGSVKVLLHAADNSAQIPNQIDIQCCALFLTEPFGVPNNISSALMRSDLVFDKALIINSYGMSSDPRVYAAGNVSKINRSTLLKKLGAREQFTFELPFSPALFTSDPIKPVVTWSLYDAAETCRYSAYQLIANRLIAQDEVGLVPEFAQPLVLSARVSNGHIFRVSRPLRDIRDQKAVAGRLFKVIKTGDLNDLGETRRYCMMEIDPLGIVDCFVVYSHEPLEDEVRQLVHRAVGLPVVLFNQLEQRWQREEVTDLIDYLCMVNNQVLLDDSVIQRVNDLVADILAADGFADQAAKLAALAGDAVRSFADVAAPALQTETGYAAIQDSAIRDRIVAKLVGTAHEIAQGVEARFYELCRGTGTRGHVAFE